MNCLNHEVLLVLVADTSVTLKLQWYLLLKDYVRPVDAPRKAFCHTTRVDIVGGELAAFQER
jgi:hypothetical protein